MLELKKVSHCYGDHCVLKATDLVLAPGERLAVMGPSGCGKTTLLRIALGLLRPTRGTVRCTFASIGTVFQEPRLLPWRTALENVNLVLGDRRDSLEQARRYLAAVELEEAGAKYPRELSGGMQQRVALARALAVEADLLVLDEPFKGLDPDLKERILALTAKKNAAVLLVTHEESEAAALGCRILKQ